MSPSLLPISNTTKQRVYTQQMGRYKKAMKQGFFLEAVFIVYAMLEDRLRSFLFHSGISNSERSLTSTSKEVTQLLVALALVDAGKAGKPINLVKLHTKRQVTQALLGWAQRPELANQEPATEFQEQLREKLARLDGSQKLAVELGELEAWASERNSLVHDLLGQDPADFQEKLKNSAEKGYGIARAIDNAVKSLRKKPDMRQKYSIQ